MNVAGGFDKNKDYAAAIKNEKDPGKRNQLISERQNKLNWMNSTGQNKNGYSNSIYGSKYSTISEKGGSAGGGSRGGGWGGYSEPDYAATAAEAKRQADYATNVAYQNAAQVKLNNAGLEKSMKETDDTYSGFNKATVDNTREESTVNKAASAGYFDPNKDYAAEIAKEKDPDKRNQLMQERNNKINWLNASGKNKWGANNGIYGSQYSTIEEKTDAPAVQNQYTPYYQDYTQGWSFDSLGKGSRAELNNRAYDIINAMRRNSAAYAAADKATRKQLAAENQAYADQLRKLGISVRQFEPGGSWYYTDREIMDGDYYESPYGYYKLYDVPEDYDMFINNNMYSDTLYAKDPKAQADLVGEWGDWFMNGADMQASAIDDQLAALQAQLDMQKTQNNNYYDDIAAQAYVAKRQAESALPQRLAAYGISGGGSESAQLGLDTSYQNNINANELARQSMLQQLDYQNILAQSQANSDKANIYAQAQKDAFNAFLQQQQWEQQQDQINWNKHTWQEEFNAQKDLLTAQNKAQMSEEQFRNWEARVKFAIQIGDTDMLDSLGFNVSYLDKMQRYELQQAAADAMKSSGSRSSGGSGRSRSSSGSSSSYSSSGSTPVVNSVSAGPQAMSSGSSTPKTNGYTFLVMNYKALGDGPAFEQKAAELIRTGQVSRADYEAFQRNYAK
jgi:hypothetical protein